VPRKYHRPPATTTKRRKSRKIPYEFERPEDGAEAEAEELEEGADDEAPFVAVDTAPELASTATRSGVAGKAERHVTVDYSYVRGEVIRIVAIMGFLVISLVITSIFR
jgi:hypothetical protein